MTKKTYILAGVLALATLLLLSASTFRKKSNVIQSHNTYSLELTSGKKYSVSQPTSLHFAIKNQNGHILKSFDTVHEKKLHLIIVRKDRTNFQHVHPLLDDANGSFKLDGFKFPNDGEYRVFADFTPGDSQMGSDGMKLAATPFQDVIAGDISQYKPQALTADKLASSTGGLDSEVYFAPSSDSPGSSRNYNLYAGQGNSLDVFIRKAGQPFKQLEPYLGSLGHMIVLGPNLEFVHAHPQTAKDAAQTGLVLFDVNFPQPGRYVAYLQTQTAGQVNTFDYAVSAVPNSATAPASQKSGATMQHMGH